MDRRVIIGLTALVAYGCNDFASPGELSKPQILAIVSDPAVIVPGGTANLSVLVADGEGFRDDINVEWALIPLPEREILGTLEPSGSTALYRAPSVIETESEGPVFADQLGVAVQVDGDWIAGQKFLLVAEQEIDNPTVDGIEIDGDVYDANSEVALPADSEVILDVHLEPAPEDPSDLAVAWYSAVGEFKLERRAPTTLKVSDPGAGPIICTVRMNGGVGWAVLETRPAN